jgi:hypothetical protein
MAEDTKDKRQPPRSAPSAPRGKGIVASGSSTESGAPLSPHLPAQSPVTDAASAAAPAAKGARSPRGGTAPARKGPPVAPLATALPALADAPAAPVASSVAAAKPVRPRAVPPAAAAPAPVIAPRVQPEPAPAAVHAQAPEPIDIRVDAVAATETVAPTVVVTPNASEAEPVASSADPKKDFSIMNTANEFSDKFQSAFKDASEKAKTAFEKSQAAFGDAGAFAKGNVEAVVESSKILASGLQELTKGYVAESKTALESFTAEVKDLATAKSPTEFFEKHSALMRKQFDAAVAASSKHSEAMLKLANEAFQPISNRVSVAVDKMKQAA